ncbi:uncharacterized protein CIMG_10007 [Coccidioides immitis RS]|uniref:Uncharacterized protein n=4 Tax=Coccidioides immitis TaxID=5501 RepID=J3K0L8_COCIM|nr:uncharacterized protein CIMG_10007 [Coccidioides immitis RS]EAS27402.3 hypothetical protein CIMG_10007 [Coccidioides immitis RS]
MGARTCLDVSVVTHTGIQLALPTRPRPLQRRRFHDARQRRPNLLEEQNAIRNLTFDEMRVSPAMHSKQSRMDESGFGTLETANIYKMKSIRTLTTYFLYNSIMSSTLSLNISNGPRPYYQLEVSG